MANRDVTSDASNTDKSTPTPSDKVMVIDVATNPDTLKESTIQQILNAINGLTEDTSPDESADFVETYDTSAGTAKKVLPKNLNVGTRFIQLTVADPNATPSTGDSKAAVVIPSTLNGYNVVSVLGFVTTVSSSGTPTLALRRLRSGSAVDVLSTNVTIDVSEYTSSTAATAAVINTSNDDLVTADILLVDLDTVGTSAKGHALLVGVQKP